TRNCTEAQSAEENTGQDTGVPNHTPRIAKDIHASSGSARFISLGDLSYVLPARIRAHRPPKKAAKSLALNCQGRLFFEAG
ncbi:MAG TPA: hypothetical protein VGG64_18060, partial [Pirellulales bacterium]